VILRAAAPIGRACLQEFPQLPRDGSDLAPPGETAQPSLALGGPGMPGFTAFIGRLEGRNFGKLVLRVADA